MVVLLGGDELIINLPSKFVNKKEAVIDDFFLYAYT